jgi:hypothetical protein
MVTANVPVQWSAPYWDQFRNHIHTILAEGYKIALPKIKVEYGCEEPATTGFLVEGMRNWLVTGPGWCDGFHVDEDPPVSGKTKAGEERKGRNRQRPDIVIGLTDRLRPEFFFEAKRLRKKGNSEEYTSSKGMGCFINGEYAPNYSEVAMLGYIEVETVSYWNSFLKREIDSKQGVLFLIPPQLDVSINPDLSFEWKSGHNRNILNKPIDIFHILFDCRP